MILAIRISKKDLAYEDDVKECIMHNLGVSSIERILLFSENEIGGLEVDAKSKKMLWIRHSVSHFEAIAKASKISKDVVIYSTPFVKFDSNVIYMAERAKRGIVFRSADSYYIFRKQMRVLQGLSLDEMLGGVFQDTTHRFRKIGYFRDGNVPVSSIGWKLSERKLEIPIVADIQIEADEKLDSECVEPADVAYVDPKLDVVIVSVDYNDFLEITLERNAEIFDNITVVTSMEDSECVEICRRFGAKVVLTDCMYSGGASFNKGKAINEGISSLHDPELILLIDADIIVGDMPNLREIDNDSIYYRDRIMVEDYDSYERLLSGESGFRIESAGALGYFQLFRYQRRRLYYENCHDAAWSDIKFARKFRKKIKIDSPVIHLGEDRKNWGGRVTGIFRKKSIAEHDDSAKADSFFDKIYCLNLDKRPDRWKSASREFERKGLSVDRFSAIDGQDLDISDIGGTDGTGALACLMGHLEMVRDAKANGYERVLIFEDDVILSDDFRDRLYSAEDMDWKVLYLGASQFSWNRIRPKDGFYRCRETLGTFAYAVHHSAYDDLIDLFESKRKNVDLLLAEYQAREKCIAFFPNIAISDVSDSDIRESKDFKKYCELMKWDIGSFQYKSLDDFSDMKKNILLVPDVRGWAFDNIAKSIVKYNPYPDLIRYDVVYVSDLKRSPDIYCYDYVYVFFEAERIIPDGPKIIRGCYSAFWLEDRRFTAEFFGKVFSECRGVVFANDDLRDSISKYLPNGFPMATMHDSADENVFYPIRGLKRNSLTAIFVGNTKRRIKRFEEIVEICEEAGVELIVCTDVKNDELVKYYNQADICINFSDSEGGPQTFIESALCGVPMLIRSSNALSKIIPCFKGDTKDEFIDILKNLKDKNGRKKCHSIGMKARSVVLEEFTYSKTASKFADFFLGIDKKKDLSDKLTAFIIRCGENPNYERCRDALENQTVTFRIEEIRDVAPMSLAFQNMIDRCETEYYIQVDEDMILEEYSVEKIYDSLLESEDNISTIAHMLRDVHLDFNIFGIKGYKHSIMKRYPYRLDVISCEMEQISRLQEDGYETMMVSEVVGYHSPEWTDELIFERYFDLMEKWKNYKYHWMSELPAKLLQIFMEDPSERNLYALMGAMSSISSEEKIRDREKNFKIRDSNFERISELLSKKEFRHIKNDVENRRDILSRKWSGKK